MPELAQPLPVSDLLRDKSLETTGSLASQVFTLLKESIISLQLRPGQMISEKEVSEALNASKTPVREAMIRLQGIGLVKIIPKSGTYVTQIQVDSYIEACFARQQLEIGAVRQAAIQQNWNANLKMESVLKKQEQALEAGEDEVFFQLDQALHHLFFVAAGVPGVSSLIRDSQAEMNRMRYLKRLHNIRREGAVIEEHRVIVSAIRKGSPNKAEAAMVNHIGSLEQEVEQLASHAGLLEFIEGLNSGRIKHRT